jgi:hypothetical protein
MTLLRRYLNGEKIVFDGLTLGWEKKGLGCNQPNPFDSWRAIWGSNPGPLVPEPSE